MLGVFAEFETKAASNPWLLMVQQPNGRLLNEANQRIFGSRRTAIGVSEVFFAKFNNDGRLDAFASTGGPDPQGAGSDGYPGEKPMFWLGQGGGKLANAASQIHAPTRINAAKGYHGAALQILINKGGNVFEDQSSSRGGFTNLTDFALFRLDIADVDNDSDPDLLLQTDYNLITDPTKPPGRFFLNSATENSNRSCSGFPYAHFIPVPRATSSSTSWRPQHSDRVRSEPGVGLTDTDFRLYKFLGPP